MISDEIIQLLLDGMLYKYSHQAAIVLLILRPLPDRVHNKIAGRCNQHLTNVKHDLCHHISIKLKHVGQNGKITNELYSQAATNQR